MTSVKKQLKEANQLLVMEGQDQGGRVHCVPLPFSDVGVGYDIDRRSGGPA